MAIGEKSKLVTWDWDLRVRDRHLATGMIEHKDVEQYLSDLPDLEVQAEIVTIEQPAIGSGGTRGADDRSSDVQDEEDEGPM
jgi:hypothetical protein